MHTENRGQIADALHRESFERDAIPHMKALQSAAIGLTKDEPSAEDLVQDTMFKAYRSWHQYRAGTNIKAWLFRILRNTFLSEQRSWYRRRVTPVEDIEKYVSDDQAVQCDPESEYVAKLAHREVVSALEQMPPEFGLALQLALRGLSYATIAKTVGIPVGTVRSRVFRARRRLQQRLEFVGAGS